MILSDIRFLVGIHLGQKGLPPSIIAPTLNILNQLDHELSVIGFEYSPELLKEFERLKNAIILQNHSSVDDDDDLSFQEMVDNVLEEKKERTILIPPPNVDDDDEDVINSLIDSDD